MDGTADNFGGGSSICVRWRVKFNRRKSKIMVVRKWKCETIWKNGEVIMKEVEEFKYLGVL